MTITGFLVATTLIFVLLVMVTLSTSLVLAGSQLLSRGVEVLFGINAPDTWRR